MAEDNHFNLLNNVPCGIFTFTSTGIINYVNDPLLRQLLYTREELTEQNVEKLLTLSSRIFYQTHFFPLLTLQGEVHEVFLTLKAKNNTSVPVLINATQQKNAGDTINICACITVNQRKKYEDEILEAKKIAEEALQKNELLQKAQYELEHGKQELDKQLTRLKHANEELLQLNEIVSHDLQEPVRKISLYVDLIEREKLYGNEKSIAYFTIIAKSSRKMRLLLQRLQHYIPVLTKPALKSNTDLNSVINTQLAIVRAEMAEATFTSTVAQLPGIMADFEQLNVLFYELIKNAVTFRNPEKKLCIDITCTLLEENSYNSIAEKYKYEEFVKISIQDNGLGFDSLYKEHIFRLLKRLSQGEGLGFGLAFCKRIAENHGGYIKASGEENKGAKFIVMLPVN